MARVSSELAMDHLSPYLWLGACTHIACSWLLAYRQGKAAARRPEECCPKSTVTWPHVSIIIPAWQESGTISGCLHALMRIDYPHWEAIVVAGGPDNTFDEAQETCAGDSRFTVIRQPPRGKNAALNLGLREAHHAIIVLLDADSRVTAEWLKRLVPPLTMAGVAATTGSFVTQRRTAIARYQEMERVASYEIDGQVILQGSGSIGMQRECLQEIGKFPETVRVGVDWDLDLRMAARGMRRAYCPDALVYTERPATLMEYWRNEVRWRRAHLTATLRQLAGFPTNPPRAWLALYLYALAWCTLSLTVVAGVTCLMHRSLNGGWMRRLWALLMAWILLRRLALPIKVATFTRDLSWLRIAWTPPFLLLLTFCASVVATISLNRQTIHFKGPRRTAQCGR